MFYVLVCFLFFFSIFCSFVLFLPLLYQLINLINNLLNFLQLLSFYFSVIALGPTILIFNQSLLVLYLTLHFLFHPSHFTSDSFHFLLSTSYFYSHFTHFRSLHGIKTFIHLILCTLSYFVFLCFINLSFKAILFALYVSLWYVFYPLQLLSRLALHFWFSVFILWCAWYGFFPM